MLASLVGLVLLAVLVAALVVQRGSEAASPAPVPDPSSATTAASPSGSTSSTSPTPSPSSSSPAAVPAGFEDCSDELGDGGYCSDDDECWAGVISVFDLPSLGTPSSCDETHVYQTFAGGLLPADVRRQSQLEDQDDVRRLCTAKTLRTMLDSDDRGTNWEVLALPPQEADGSDQVFRCLFGRGDRSSPVNLRSPR